MNNPIEDIMRAINGEYSAIFCYESLARLAPNEEAGKQIMEIREREIRHYRAFAQIYHALTGRQPVPRIAEKCEAEYMAGLIASFKDEQRTTGLYLDIAEKLHDPYMKETFRRASADEQNHAVWFLYFLTAEHSNAGLAESPAPSVDFGATGALQAASFTLPSMLTYALQEEYLNKAVYDAVIRKFGPVPLFVHITEEEQTHIEALLPFFEKYRVPVPHQSVAATLVSVPETVRQAFALGIRSETDNIAMYGKFLAADLPSDVRAVFTRLRDASRHHLAEFREAYGGEPKPHVHP